VACCIAAVVAGRRNRREVGGAPVPDRVEETV
jgi:hypothetical protein